MSRALHSDPSNPRPVPDAGGAATPLDGDDAGAAQHFQVLAAGSEIMTDDGDTPFRADPSFQGWQAEVRKLTRELASAAEAQDSRRVSELLGVRCDMYRQRGSFGQALKDAEMCADIAWCNWTLDARALFRLGVARLEAGDHDRAAWQDLRQARHLDPDLPRILEWLRRARHWSATPGRRNHYRTLRVEADAADDRVRAAYKWQLLRWHPDKDGGDAAKFWAVQEAWGVLGDADSRHVYDFGRGRSEQRAAREHLKQATYMRGRNGGSDNTPFCPSPYVHVNANNPFEHMPEHDERNERPVERSRKINYHT